MNTPDYENLTEKNNASSEHLKLFAGILSKLEMEQVMLEKEVNEGTCFLVDFCDVEIIKENLGENAAVQILNRFAMKLKQISRDTDIIARIEEGTFFIYMPIILAKEEVHHVMGRLNQCIQNEMSINKIEMFVREGVEIAAVTSQDRKMSSLDSVVTYLTDILEHNEADQSSCMESSETDAIFSRVFSMEVNQLLTPDELTKTMKSMNNTYRGNFFIRLEDKSYVVLKDLLSEPEKDREVYKDAQDMLSTNVSRKVRAEYQTSMFSFVNLDTLAERMNDTDSIKYEFQNNQNIWCVATFSVVDRKNGIATKVDFRISGLTHDRAEAQELLQMQKEAISKISNSELLFISIIDKETGASRVIQSTRLIDSNRIYDFDHSMKLEASHLLPNDQKKFLESVQLKELNSILEKNQQYSISAFLKLPDTGKLIRVSYHFSYNDRFPKYILSTTEDVTEAYICDRVTGLKNFNGFRMDCMYEFSKAAPHQYVVMNFNIANFKAINTMYGYQAGDWLLKKVLLALSECEIPFCSVSRENADNYFCLCRKENYDQAVLNQLCKMKIRDDNGLADKLELFCGVYCISNDNESLDSICDKARIATRHAEQEIGVNTYVLDEKEQQRYLDDAAILSSISEAIKNGELVVYYQPIYNAQNGELTSAEALVRWQHPEKGLIPPNIFLPAVERTGQIAEIDLFVARHVQKFQIDRFQSGRHMIPISINVSRYDFIQEKYLENALIEMRKYLEIANMIRIEITESGLINIPRSGEAFMHEMRSMGIQTMIDDFGTGYSSLASVVDRPCDIIKLDMSFARQIGIKKKMEILVKGAIETAHNLEVSVVAEGVETKEQYEFLKNNGCDYIQGYYFAKPMPQKEFEKLLDKGQK